MKIRLEEYAEKLTDITTDIISLTESNAMVNRCNEGLFFPNATGSRQIREATARHLKAGEHVYWRAR